MKNKTAFIFFGASGSGKGTQAKLLKKYLEENDSRKISYIETGNRFRSFAENKNYLPGKITETITSGGLLPVFLSVWNWTNAFFDELEEDTHIVLDGSPRRQLELPVLESALDYLDYQDVHIISLDVPRELLVSRLLERERNDDDTTQIEKRLDWFMEEVQPMLDYYSENPRYKFHDIDGSKSIEEIQNEILTKIK
ncbi:MAG: nucleoside monophosphate kinase [Candidatus Paceibacterota bacterium]